MKQLYEGKSKIIFEGDNPQECIIRYKDTATAGNGVKKEEFSGKGAMNAAISHKLFAYLADNGIETHEIEVLDAVTVRAKKVEIIDVEVIVRNIAAGSFAKKYGVEEGRPLNNTVVEFSLKSDELGDPMINDSHITALGLATQEELDTLKEKALRINTLLQEYFKKIGIVLVDFKLEFGRFGDQILLSDEISPDSCRLWDAETMEKLDKDVFRRDLGDLVHTYEIVLHRMEEQEKADA